MPVIFVAKNFLPNMFFSQHFLNFLFEPQGQGSFLPIFFFTEHLYGIKFYHKFFFFVYSNLTFLNWLL